MANKWLVNPGHCAAVFWNLVFLELEIAWGLNYHIVVFILPLDRHTHHKLHPLTCYKQILSSPPRCQPTWCDPLSQSSWSLDMWSLDLLDSVLLECENVLDSEHRHMYVWEFPPPQKLLSTLAQSCSMWVSSIYQSGHSAKYSIFLGFSLILC